MPDRNEDRSSRIYLFKSESNKGLRAFAADLDGSKLPSRHGPWSAIGSVAAHKDLPHGLPRAAVERALDGAGFQLWRLKPTEEESPTAE